MNDSQNFDEPLPGNRDITQIILFLQKEHGKVLKGALKPSNNNSFNRRVISGAATPGANTVLLHTFIFSKCHSVRSVYLPVGT